MCGYEYTNKLNRMFMDVTVCADLTARFNNYLAESPDRELPHTVNMSILQVCSSDSSVYSSSSGSGSGSGSGSSYCT